jgi:NADPH-dependent 2,4-dienoyl-CoA reductase/sulfur reductase-like enzyme
LRSVECVVVGGGPAGLSAARSAARHGVRVLLVDENSELGGQYYRQASSPVRAAADERESREGRLLIDEVRALGVECRQGATVWGVFDQRIVAFATEAGAERVGADTLILAAGAYDRPVPFPGWTLPGVITAGGAQNLVKGSGVLPGRRVLVAGSGPLLLAVAHSVIEGGARVVALCEASPMRRFWRFAHRLLPHLDFVQRSLRYRREIRGAGVPFLTGHVIRRALGATEVDGAVVARCDEDWRPVAGTERRLDVDTVVVGYGLVPSLELSRLAGCEHRYVPERGAYAPIRNREMESTVPGVYVVGDGAVVAGATMALEEGHLAGLAVAHRLGRSVGRDHAREASRARGRLLHRAGLRGIMDEVYRFGPGVYALADDETMLCRCEEVTVRAALGAARDGAIEVDEVKARTRIGMGRCQGRMCGPALAHLVVGVTGRRVTEVGSFTPRPPVKPVPLGALARESQ